MSILNIFGKTKPRVSVDFSAIGVDFHSHLLPQVDDGSQSIEETLEVLRALRDRGYSRVYTSPHIMSIGYQNTRDDLKEQFLSIQARLEEVMPIGLIAEYMIEEGFEELVERDELLTFGSKHVLVETSMNYEYPKFLDTLYLLQTKGYKPILAHPERYRYMYTSTKNLDYYERIRDMGVELQLNMFSLIGAYNPQVQKIAEALIAEEKIDYVCTDLHRSRQIEWLEAASQNVWLERLVTSGQLRNIEFDK